jgi:aryl-alcohol dehydrogenase-like predicted oxidoreductase
MRPMAAAVLGHTGLQVSRLGLGLAALGRPGYINLGHAADLAGDDDPDALGRRAQRVLDAAWNAGLRYFDAARSYGLAERFLAEWLSSRSVAPGAVVIGSKWGYRYTAGWRTQAAAHEVKEHSLEAFRRQWAESTGLLRDFIRLYQIHSATLESGVLEDDALLDALTQLRTEGVHVGLSLSGPAQGATLRRAMQVTRDGLPLFESVQATWNLLETSAAPALAEAHDAGMGVIIKEALANGRLTGRDRDPHAAANLRLLRELAEKQGASLDTLAIAACLAQPFADVVLSGACTVSQLDSNVQASSVRLEDETLVRLAGFAEPAAEYWRRRQTLPWN